MPVVPRVIEPTGAPAGRELGGGVTSSLNDLAAVRFEPGCRRTAFGVEKFEQVRQDDALELATDERDVDLCLERRRQRRTTTIGRNPGASNDVARTAGDRCRRMSGDGRAVEVEVLVAGDHHVL